MITLDLILGQEGKSPQSQNQNPGTPTNTKPPLLTFPVLTKIQTQIPTPMTLFLKTVRTAKRMKKRRKKLMS